MATICCSPPDSRPAFARRRIFKRGKSPYMRSRSALSSRRPGRRAKPPDRRFFLDGELGEAVPPLQDLHDTLTNEVGRTKPARRHAAPGDRTFADAAARGAEQVRHSLERRALPGAVGAEQSYDRALRNPKGHPAQGQEGGRHRSLRRHRREAGSARGQSSVRFLSWSRLRGPGGSSPWRRRLPWRRSHRGTGDGRPAASRSAGSTWCRPTAGSWRPAGLHDPAP